MLKMLISKTFLWWPSRISEIVHVISFIVVDTIETLVVINTLVTAIIFDVVSFITETPKTTKRILTY